VDRALFLIDSASAFEVRCGGVRVAGTTSARIRKFPGGDCHVQASILGASYSAVVPVERPREVRCDLSAGVLTCS
jgi:hypothetical protein